MDKFRRLGQAVILALCVVVILAGAMFGALS